MFQTLSDLFARLLSFFTGKNAQSQAEKEAANKEQAKAEITDVNLAIKEMEKKQNG